MPHIIVTADKSRADDAEAVMFTERVSVSDFESEHFQAQLVERLGWAVGDANAVEQRDADRAQHDAERTEHDAERAHQHPEWAAPDAEPDPQREQLEAARARQLAAARSN